MTIGDDALRRQRMIIQARKREEDQARKAAQPEATVPVKARGSRQSRFVHLLSNPESVTLMYARTVCNNSVRPRTGGTINHAEVTCPICRRMAGISEGEK